MWQVALGWHAIKFSKTFAILEFYIWFRFWPYHHSWHVILHQSVKFYPNRTTLSRKKQELSYRKQIARQLRTQFIEGISLTLKSTLRVTQGHWKLNRWTDHWSLKLMPFESLGAVSYSPSIVTMAVSVVVCEIFSVKEWRDLENQVRDR